MLRIYDVRWVHGIHKGLDLTLDAFVTMPQYHLTIFGPLEGINNLQTNYHEEIDFVNAYRKELYETANIKTYGWVDVENPAFLELTKKSIGFVYPSSSEALSGSVLICLHAGLIPIISAQSGVDVEDFGIILDDCSVNNIKNAIDKISKLPTDKLKEMSYKAWLYAQQNHTREKFSEKYIHAIDTIFKERGIPV